MPEQNSIDPDIQMRDVQTRRCRYMLCGLNAVAKRRTFQSDKKGKQMVNLIEEDDVMS